MAGYEYKLEKLTPFVKAMDAMPDPWILACGWLSNHGKEGWVCDDVRMEFADAPPRITLHPTTKIGDDEWILLRKQV
jgi:hypothetical protein